MGVVFDEVVSHLESPPQPPEAQQEEVCEKQQSPVEKDYCWGQQQSTFRRRQQRLEAD